MKIDTSAFQGLNVKTACHTLTVHLPLPHYSSRLNVTTGKLSRVTLALERTSSVGILREENKAEIAPLTDGSLCVQDGAGRDRSSK